MLFTRILSSRFHADQARPQGDKTNMEKAQQSSHITTKQNKNKKEHGIIQRPSGD
jgi:hypothetical protein